MQHDLPVLLQQAEFSKEVVGLQNALSVGQIGELLLDNQVADPVHAGSDGQAELALVNSIGAVGKDPDTAAEAEVLRILWDKVQLVGELPVDL